ncbi:hypothetical protein JHK85_000670 [Glycine max]|nr:hypothetical protein JHK87_000662 [Glycine soja]KAG5068293.1 hypothetical protein JHK85_000670 [Glycine max]KAG5088038.1 hypothetical protein JHK86_000650 [Glycine max]
MKESVGMDLFLVMMESLHPKRVQKRSLHKKQTDLEGRTPVKGKEIKANAKGKCSEDLKVNEEETFEKPTKPNALIECQGDSIDLSGDMGAVGWIIISNSPSANQEICLDLKGLHDFEEAMGDCDLIKASKVLLLLGSVAILKRGLIV